MLFTITPLAERVSTARMYVAMDYGNLTDEQVRQFQEDIIKQDIPIIESQRPELPSLTASGYGNWG